ncbi:MAG: TMEM43 family protein [Candidatus Eremiobacterota bacterium]
MTTEVTSKGWFQRLGEAIGGVLFGLILFLVAFPLLWWNEGNSVRRAQVLSQGRGAVVSIQSDKVDSANEGKLVHLTGEATSEGTLTDEELGVSAPHALQLRRKVEMYQWKQNEEKETRKKLGGGEETVTKYTYEKVWSDEVIPSGDFKEASSHQNPSEMPFQAEDLVAQDATVGAFQLGELTSQVDNWSSLSVQLTSEAEEAGLTEYQNGFYGGEKPGSPQIGDVRINYSEVKPGPVSVLAQQTGQGFSQYQPKGSSSAIFDARVGTKTADEMFTALEQENAILTWILRVVGFFCMFIGLALILRPISVMADVVPLFGDLAEMGTGLVAFGTAATLSLITIALAWVAARPLLGGLLLAGAAGAAFWLFTRRRKK